MHAPPAPLPPSAAASGSGIACVALIGPQNQPLLLRLPARAQQQQQQQQHEGAADQQQQQQLLRFSYIAHCALDALEERVLLARRAPGGAPSAYLGLLYPTEEYRVYGYCSATHLKVVLVVEPTVAGAGAAGAGGDYGASPPSSWPPDAALSGLCRRLHSLYVDAASNPFFAPGAPLEDDPRVLRGVDAALAEFSAAVGGGGGGRAAAAAGQAGIATTAAPGVI